MGLGRRVALAKVNALIWILQHVCAINEAKCSRLVDYERAWEGSSSELLKNTRRDCKRRNYMSTSKVYIKYTYRKMLSCDLQYPSSCLLFFFFCFYYAQQMASSWLDTDGVSVVVSNIPPSVGFALALTPEQKLFPRFIVCRCLLTYVWLIHARNQATRRCRCTASRTAKGRNAFFRDFEFPLTCRRETRPVADVYLFMFVDVAALGASQRGVMGDIKLNICDGRCPLNSLIDILSLLPTHTLTLFLHRTSVSRCWDFSVEFKLQLLF